MGTSGWAYDAWREPFHDGLPKEEWLSFCQSDPADWPLWDAITTDLVYVRLHDHRVTYAPPTRTPSSEPTR